MATFLVKRGGPSHVTIREGGSAVKIPVHTVGAQRRVTVPDEHADKIDAKHAKHLVRVSAAAFEAEEQKTIPASPQAKRKIKIEG